MTPQLLERYVTELAHLRATAGEFAMAFPGIASHLALSQTEVADPFVERLLEGVAFLNARLQVQIDADHDVLVSHLLESLFPEYVAPLPACGIVRLVSEPRASYPPGGVRVARNTMLHAVVDRPSVAGHAGESVLCRFRTAHDIELLPLEVRSAAIQPHFADLPLGAHPESRRIRGAMRLRLGTTNGAPIAALGLRHLDLFVDAPDEIAGLLHETVMAEGLAACVFDPARRAIDLADGLGVIALGFAPEQSVLPDAGRGLSAQRLLLEYFAYPKRFNFLRIEGLDRLRLPPDAGEFEIVLPLGRLPGGLEGQVGAGNLVLHATPLVNLAEAELDRVLLDPSRHEHPLHADRARPFDHEIYALSGMTALEDGTGKRLPVAPLHGVMPGSTGSRIRYCLRRENRHVPLKADVTGQGVQTRMVHQAHVALTGPDGGLAPVRVRELAVTALVTNADAPQAIPVGRAQGFSIECDAPVDSVTVLKPFVRPPLRSASGSLAWRLLALYRFGGLGALEAGDPRRSAAELRSLLALHVPGDDRRASSLIDAIETLECSTAFERLPGPGPIAFGRGLKIELGVDEQAVRTAGLYQFGTVIREFLARQVSANSFVRFTIVPGGQHRADGHASRGGARGAT